MLNYYLKIPILKYKANHKTTTFTSKRVLKYTKDKKLNSKGFLILPKGVISQIILHMVGFLSLFLQNFIKEENYK